MDYVIVNPNKKVYIRLNGHGLPETCSKSQAQKFENFKARNVLDNLPKSLKKFHFKIEYLPEKIVNRDIETSKPTCIVNECNKPSDGVHHWLEKVKTCNQFASDAAKRKEELLKAESNIDKELSNCLHKIEFEKHKNACAGYKEYNQVKHILEKRRIIKDELMVVKLILFFSNLESIATDKIQKVIDGLDKRVFEIREIEKWER